jgi:hypothetical protein
VQPVLKYESAKWLVHKEEPAASSKQGKQEPAASSKPTKYHRLQAQLEDHLGQAPGPPPAVMGKEPAYTRAAPPPPPPPPPASTGAAAATAAAALRPGQRKWGFR